MKNLPAYVLITPARNEAEFIELTIRSVVAQTVKPVKWVVVSDGSTDGTDEIVTKYAADHPWIQLVRMPERRQRHFAGKVLAFNAGHATLTGLAYDIIANLDGDVSFEPDYFEFLLTKFADIPTLGVSGTPFMEDSSGSFHYDYKFCGTEHVSGQVQLFRRQCFEDIGGYVPRQVGGIDLVAVLTARMKGWHTQTFLEKPYFHHRRMGTATNNRFLVPFRGGKVDYILGSHPLWHLFRCIYQATRRPYVLAGGLRLVGFLCAMVTRTEKQVPGDLVQFRRKEQMGRLWRLVKRPSNPLSSDLRVPKSSRIGRPAVPERYASVGKGKS